MRKIIPTLLVFAVAAFLFSCMPPVPPPISSENSPSTAFFGVPPALSANQSGKTLTSDGWVTSSVKSYYEYVRGQVRFGANVAEAVKAFLEDLEQVQYGGGYLLDSTVNATITDASGTLRWTTIGGGEYLLEKWDAADVKILELDFSRVSGRYFGTVIMSSAVLPVAAAGLKTPDMISIAFDSANPADGGAATLVIKASDFRAHTDLAVGVGGADESASGQEDIIISLKKDSSGTMTLGSIAKVINSRHFVWNGYTYESVLNPAAAPETRYYTAAGSCSSAGLATVHLGIPLIFDADVFTNNGVGSIVAALFTGRLNNDYAFDGSGTTGHTVITTLNGLAAVNPKLNDAPYNSTPAQVYLALGQAKAFLDGADTPNDMVDYLVSMMSILNPAYFNANDYTGFGAVAPAAGYPALDDASARALLPPVADVDGLADGSTPIVFASTAAP